MVRWLHISDLHIAEHADWNNFKNELLQKCQEHGKIDLVIVTGDFHNFSEHTDFHLSADFLRDLIKCLGLDIQQDLFIVPGNHDGVSNVQEKDIRIKAAKYDPFSNMAQWVVTLLAAFQGYENFVKTLIPNYSEVHPAGIHSSIRRPNKQTSCLTSTPWPQRLTGRICPISFWPTTASLICTKSFNPG